LPLPGPTWSLEICFTNSFEFPSHDGRGLHHAIDILGDVGLIVASATNGTVARYYFYGRRYNGVDTGHNAGNFVVIIDEDGFMHYYAHLGEPRVVSPGQRVAAGQQIGWLGRTGLGQFGPTHVHYQTIEPRPDSTRDGTNGFSTHEAGKVVCNQFHELERLAHKGVWHLDDRGRIVIPPPVRA
jgi:murein DD-endopeptidase MepM/ murein hydrolase activator NlpD